MAHGFDERENMSYTDKIMKVIWNDNYDYSWIWVQKQQVFHETLQIYQNQ